MEKRAKSKTQDDLNANTVPVNKSDKLQTAENNHCGTCSQIQNFQVSDSMGYYVNGNKKPVYQKQTQENYVRDSLSASTVSNDRKRVQNSNRGKMYLGANQHWMGTVQHDGFYCLCGNRNPTHQARNFHSTYQTQIRTYNCQFCSQQFSDLNQMNAHVKSAHWTFHPSQNHQSLEADNFNKLCQLSQLNTKQQHNSSGLKTTKDLNFIPVTYSSVLGPTRCKMSYYHSFIGIQEANIHLCKCGMKFGDLRTLNAHMQYFAANKNFTCRICRKRYTSHHYTKSHMRLMHNVVIPKYVACNVCGVVFASREEYMRHLVNIYDRNLPICASRICPMLQIKSWNRQKLPRCKDTTISQPSSQAVSVAEIEENTDSTIQSYKPISRAPYSVEQVRNSLPVSQICNNRKSPGLGTPLTTEHQTEAIDLSTRTQFLPNFGQHSGYCRVTQSFSTNTSLTCTQVPSVNSGESHENLSSDSTAQILNDIREFWSSLYQPKNLT